MKRLLLLSIMVAISVSGCALTEATKKKATYHSQMGISYLGEGDPTKALIEFTDAEKYTPDDPELLYYLGKTYVLKKRPDLAEPKFLRAIELRPNYSEAKNELGVMYLQMKRWDDAYRLFMEVSEDLFYLHPEYAQVNMGVALLGKSDTARALNILRGAVVNYPQFPPARLYLGRVYAATEKFDLAIAEFKAAIELFNDYADAHYHLALAYMKKGENRSAAASFREVVRIAPDSELGRLAREYLDLLK